MTDKVDMDEMIEMTFANGEKVKATRRQVEDALRRVSERKLVEHIRAEIGLVKYFETMDEEQKKAQEAKNGAAQ